MAFQHVFVFRTENHAKTFQVKLHLYLKEIVSQINGCEVTVIDGKNPPQTSAIEKLAKHSTDSFKRMIGY